MWSLNCVPKIVIKKKIEKQKINKNSSHKTEVVNCYHTGNSMTMIRKMWFFKDLINTAAPNFDSSAKAHGTAENIP